ncbi:hypothetical protein BC008_45650 [Mastigocoleus testarum BC008]|uniref:Lipoprotein n=2 Tax=Mastigocoleus TaxID=996924 RepID=A0A0V8A160_9CYAN|nr:hypothetical protein BC008_21700 [Mastigocoleus testarum BC008]KST70471.1 hypothetical protein BC008_45650 [Mastigocoleus testarum BC008]
MKYPWFNLLRKTILVTALCTLIFSAASCTNTQTNPPPRESASTPTPTETPNSSRNQELPSDVQSAVLSDAAKRSSKTVATLRITETQKQSWGNSCLGLAQPGEVCAQVIVPGWKVVVSDGQREWVYRTDESGKQVKLEDLQT